LDSERRQHKRFKIRLNASIDGKTDDPSVAIPSALILDLSLGGAYCEVSHYVEPLTKVLLTVDFIADEGTESQGETAVCRGVVVRTEPTSGKKDRYRMGILFTEISRTDKEKLQRFLSHKIDENSS
jgi:c-di-GMP-binding flagellar brake protein YcgR